MPKKRDLTGLVFGRLTVLKESKANPRHWVCECSCKNIVTVSGKSLTRSKKSTKSCGCLAREKARELGQKRTRHGLSHTRTHSIWRGILDRTLNPRNSSFVHYGGRGITVDSRWLLFENFIADMGMAPDKYEIDRIDNNSHYCKKNCRWATRKQQVSNTRNTRYVTDGTQILSMSVFADTYFSGNYQKAYDAVARGKHTICDGDIWIILDKERENG